jgi:hypothetical protein
VFGRRSQDEQSASRTATAEPADRARDPQAPKGRPTPKRRDAQSQRRSPVNAGSGGDRKEAARRMREARRREVNERREGMLRGDERYLPARDKGPVRRATRDYIDSRWHAAEFFVPGVFVILLVSTLSYALYVPLWGLLALSIIGQSAFTGYRLRAELARRFPDRDRTGAVRYGLFRTLRMRRLRMPKPQVKRGEHRKAR